MKPKILVVDIETAPIQAYVWGLFDQNIALNQIKSDWHLLSWSAKWLDSKTMMYADQRHVKDVKNDKELITGVWNLLDQADIVIGQNSQAFDIKKLNARFIHHNMKPPSSFNQIDTMKLAKKYFAFTSNKLEYMSKALNKQYKKLKTKQFQGFELWSECLKGNLAAWKEMEQYNKYDVLATEELYKRLIVYDTSINLSAYYNKDVRICTCGSRDFKKNGFNYSAKCVYQKYTCLKCGAHTKDSKNLRR